MIGKCDLDGMVIGRKTHKQDVCIVDGKVMPWKRWRKGEVNKCDLKRLLAAKPTYLVIGTGCRADLSVPESVLKSIPENVTVMASGTFAAVGQFNTLLRQCRWSDDVVVGAFKVT